MKSKIKCRVTFGVPQSLLPTREKNFTVKFNTVKLMTLANDKMVFLLIYFEVSDSVSEIVHPICC